MDVEEIVGKVSALVPGWFAASELESVLDWQLKFSGLERGQRKQKWKSGVKSVVLLEQLYKESKGRERRKRKGKKRKKWGLTSIPHILCKTYIKHLYQKLTIGKK